MIDSYHQLVILLTYLPLHDNLQDPHTEVLISIASAPSRSHVFTVQVTCRFISAHKGGLAASVTLALVCKLQRLLCHVVNMIENQMVRC